MPEKLPHYHGDSCKDLNRTKTFKLSTAHTADSIQRSREANVSSAQGLPHAFVGHQVNRADSSEM
jgi:hypothetical protein